MSWVGLPAGPALVSAKRAGRRPRVILYVSVILKRSLHIRGTRSSLVLSYANMTAIALLAYTRCSRIFLHFHPYWQKRQRPTWCRGPPPCSQWPPHEVGLLD